MDKLVKELRKLVSEYSYQWGEHKTIDDYLDAFDYKDVCKVRGWGFRWYQYVDDEIMALWSELELSHRILVYWGGCRAADDAESAAAGAAGEDW